MNIYAKPGTKVKYIGATDAQVWWGNHTDPRLVLEAGKEYIVRRTEVHNWHTKVILKEADGAFPSSCFE
jgi:hypothetical protein